MSSPSVGCTERSQLLDRIKAAMTAIIDLKNREMNAVLSGSVSELDALAEDLRRQRQIKDDLMLAYKLHVQTHGC